MVSSRSPIRPSEESASMSREGMRKRRAMRPTKDEPSTTSSRGSVAKVEWTSIPSPERRATMEYTLTIRGNSSVYPASVANYIVSNRAYPVRRAVDNDRRIATSPSPSDSSQGPAYTSVYSDPRNANTVARYRNPSKVSSTDRSIRSSESRNSIDARSSRSSIVGTRANPGTEHYDAHTPIGSKNAANIVEVDAASLIAIVENLNRPSRKAPPSSKNPGSSWIIASSGSPKSRNKSTSSTGTSRIAATGSNTSAGSSSKPSRRSTRPSYPPNSRSQVAMQSSPVETYIKVAPSTAPK